MSLVCDGDEAIIVYRSAQVVEPSRPCVYIKRGVVTGHPWQATVSRQ